MLSSIILYLLRQDLFLNVELTHSISLAGQFVSVSLSVVLGYTQTAMPIL